MRTRISLISAVFAAFFAAATAALATVTGSSPNISFAGNWPAYQPVAAGSSVPGLAVDVAAATAGGIPFANGAYGGVHSIAHLVDGKYGNAYSWLTTSQSLTRNAAHLNNVGAGGDQIVRYIGINQTATLTGLCFSGPTAKWNPKGFDVNNGAADVDLLMASNIVICSLRSRCGPDARRCSSQPARWFRPREAP